MIKILYNIIYGYINVKCCGCDKLLKINSYDYNNNRLYCCSTGCAIITGPS